MAKASGVGARITARAVPILDGARPLAAAGAIAGGTTRNLEWMAGKAAWSAVDDVTRLLLVDAQTSGGLLIAVEPARAEALEAALRARGVETVARIGEIVPRNEVPIAVLT